ncbi:MAG: Ig-like domain-containing protein, partial [Patescibacteria group bacterium]|nr:Ig-like domain-containing protein [Patescibacteria group bacterium]
MKRTTVVIIALSCAAVISTGVVLYLNETRNPADHSVTLTNTPLIVSEGTDQFTLKADIQDSLGVSPNSTFTLKSEEPLSQTLIKSHLTIEPNFSYRIESSDSNTYTIIPENKLEKNTVYSFSLATQTTGESQQREYSWAYQIKDAFKILGTTPRDKGTGVPTNSGIEITFTHENFKSYEEYITITPEASGRFEQYRKTLVFVPDALQEGTVYTVTVKAGLPLSDSEETLASDYTFQFVTQSSSRYEQGYLQFMDTFYEYPTDETPAFGLYEYNTGLTSAPVSVWRFENFTQFTDAISEMNQIPSWAYDARQRANYSTESLQEVVNFTAEIESQESTKFFRLADSLPTGHYLVEVTYKTQKAQVFLQISNLAASLQVSPTKSFVWVQSHQTGTAVPGATITFSADSTFNEKTNDNGLALFATPEPISSNDTTAQQDFFTVQNAGEQLLVPLEAYYDSNWWYGGSSGEPYWSYLYPNRTLYQPSDTIKFWGVIKKRNGTAVPEVTIALNGYSYDIFGSADNAVATTKVGVSDMGTFDGQLMFENLNPGGYQLEASIGDTVIASSWISVETYTKPPYKIEISTPRKAIFEGENANFELSTSFYDGTPIPNLDLHYTGSFGEGNVKTDSNGRASVSVKTSYSSSSYYPSSDYFSVSPVQSEIANISTDATLYLFGPKFLISMQHDAGGTVTGTVNNVSLTSINADGDLYAWDYTGDPAPSIPVKLQQYHIWYEKIKTGTRYDFINKVTYDTYRYEQHEDQVAEATVTSANDGTFQHTFNVDQDKDYRVIATITDPDQRTATTSIWFYGDDQPHTYYRENYSGMDSYYLSNAKTAESESNQSVDTYSWYYGGAKYIPGEAVSMTFFKNESALPQAEYNSYLFFKDREGILDVSASPDPT